MKHSPPAPRAAQPWQLVLITLPQPFALNMILPGLQDLGAAFGRSAAEASLFITCFGIGMAIGHLTLSSLSDKYGRRPILLLGLSCFTLTTLIAALTSYDWVMLTMRFLQGLTAVSGLSMARAMLRDTRPLDQAASGIAFLLLGMSLGPLFAPVLGGVLAELGPWQLQFWVMILLNLPALYIAYRYCPETHSAVAANALVLAAHNLKALLATRIFRQLLILPMLSGMMYFSTLSGVTQIGVQEFDLTPTQISLAYIVNALGTMMGAAITSRLVLKHPITAMGYIALSVAFIGMSAVLANHFFNPGKPILFYMSFGVMQMGVAMFMPVSMTMILDVKSNQIGAASGLGAALQMGTGAVAAAIFGQLMWLFPITPVTYWVTGAITLGIFVAARQLLVIKEQPELSAT